MKNFKQKWFCLKIIGEKMKLWNGVSKFLFGGECLGCQRSDLPLDSWLCPNCKRELKRLAKSPRRPNPDVLCLYAMTPLTKSLVHGLKYGSMPGLASYLVKIALQEEESSEVLREWGRKLAFVPVPLHSARMRERGYNQAEKLAQTIARCSGGVVANALKRKTFRISQTQLSREGRASNVAGAFEWKKNFTWPEYHVPVIVDDVFTTGATTTACLYAFEKRKMGGAAKVCTLLREESATARIDFAADNAMEWNV